MNKGFDKISAALCTLAAIAFLIALGLFLQGVYLNMQTTEFELKVYQPENSEVVIAIAEQQAILKEGPRVLDKENGTAVIPVKMAMEILAK